MKMLQKFTLIILFSTIGLFYSCNFFNKIKDQTESEVIVNNCGLLTFPDSNTYLLLHSITESNLDNFNPTSSQDEEKPLIDFEDRKGYTSFRSLIRTRENAIENSGDEITDLNDPDTILFDNVVLQSFLNQDRMMQVGNEIYFFKNDCALIKYKIVENCANTVELIKNHQDTGFSVNLAFEVTNICDNEIDFKSISRSFCDIVDIVIEDIDKCNPTLVKFKISYGSSNSGYNFSGGSLDMGDGNIIPLNGPSTSTSCSNCEIITYDYPSNNSQIAYTTKLNVDFGSQCSITPISKDIKILPPCAVNIVTQSDRLNVFFSTEQCSNITYQQPITYSWNFGDPSSGSSNTSNLPNPSHIFPCERDDGYLVSVNYKSGNCQYTEVQRVFPKDITCCQKYNSYPRCTPHHRNYCVYYIESTDRKHRVRVKIKERNNKITVVAIHKIPRNNNSNKYKRAKAQMKTSVEGPVYTQNTCSCDTDHNFSIIKGFKNRKRLRNRKKNLPNSWSRKENDEWKVYLTVQGSDINNRIVKIACQ